MDAHSLLVEEWAESTDQRFTDSGVGGTENEEKVEEGTDVAVFDGKEAFTPQQQKL